METDMATVMDCPISSISNRTGGFEFQKLYDVYLHLNATCLATSEIFFANTRMLTLKTCNWITGNTNSIMTGWTAYSIDDMWTRIVTWKLPLFQLVAQFPRPPLGFTIETATILHLLADPIDSTTSMLLALKICKARVGLAKELCERIRITYPGTYDRRWKELALVMISYDECGRSDKVPGFCEEYRELCGDAGVQDRFRDLYAETAGSLAADRSTKSLPVFAAELIFIGGWTIALIKAASSDPNPTNWPNVEVHSVALSALYLWVTAAVVMGSVIGASQSESAIPRILHGFEFQMAHFRGNPVTQPSARNRDESSWCRTSTDRAIHGGVHSWRPTKWNDVSKDGDIKTRTLVSYSLASTLFVGSGFAIAIILSYLVPPSGPSCRHIPQSCMFFLWIVSFAIEYGLERWHPRLLFRAVFCKDIFFSLATIGIVTIAQWGIMNSCACYTMWGLAGLHLPQLPEVKPELMHIVREIAPIIVSVALLFQLGFCAVLLWTYWDAVRVYVQRDDGISNLASGKRKPEEPNEPKVVTQEEEEEIEMDMGVEEEEIEMDMGVSHR